MTRNGLGLRDAGPGRIHNGPGAILFRACVKSLWITSHCEWPAAQPARNWDVGPPRGSHCAKGIGLRLKGPQKCSDVRLFTLPKGKASQQTSRDQQGDPYKVGPPRISVLLRLVSRHASSCPQLQQWRAPMRLLMRKSKLRMEHDQSAQG